MANPSGTPQSSPRLSLVLDPELKSMHLRINDGNRLLAGMVLSTDQLDDAMAALEKIRGRMQPPRPVEAALPEPEPPEMEPPAPEMPEPAPIPEPEPPVPAPIPEPAPKEFSAAVARTIKGTHYDFGMDEVSRELIFSLRDETLGWLSLRFGARLLERMLKVARAAQKSAPKAPKP
jgi:hypothetical protein